MRIVFMGTGPFCVPSLQAVQESGHDVVAIITRPDRPGPGNKKPPANPMRDAAVAAGLPVHAPEDVNATAGLELVKSLQPDALVVCDFGQILSKACLSIPPKGGVNLHASLLPKYRGAAPIHWAIFYGETETGVSVIHMTPKLDGGPIVAMKKVAIGPSETTEQLEPRLAEIGAAAVLDSLNLLATWDGNSDLGEVQDHSKATKAPRLAKNDGRVQWTRSARQIFNQVRAFQPWPGTFTLVPRSKGDPIRLILEEVSVVAEAADEVPDLAESDPSPGTVVKVEKDVLWLATGSGILAIHRVKPSGKRVMDIGEWLRGYPQELGAQWSVEL
jgi:methionyl-tRNA formyltransferase